MIRRLPIALKTTFCAFVLTASPLVATAKTLQMIETLRAEAFRQEKSYLPKYIDDTVTMCTNSQNTTVQKESCLQNLHDRATTVLQCETSPERWVEMALLDRNAVVETLKTTGASETPIHIKNLFETIVLAAQKLTAESNPALPAKALALKIQWNLSAYSPKVINAQASAGGDVLIASQFWASNSAFNNNDIRAILAHEVAHVILNHSLQMGCLGLEWNQGVGSLENAMTIFSEDMFGSFPLGQSRQALSKRNELLADKYAVLILKAMNYPASDMTSALIKLRDSLPGGGFSTGSHPDFDERIAQTQQM